MSNLAQLLATIQQQHGGPGGPGTGAATPPTFGQGDQTLALIQKILQQGQRPQLAQPVPSPVPQPGTQHQIHNEKFQGPVNFASGLTSGIQSAIAGQKAAKLAHAESQWNAMATLMQDQSPEGKQKLNNWFIANQKDLKNMAKALNQDWLNPEKTDVWKQALGSTLKNQQNKQNAASGMMQMFKHLIGKAQSNQPQLSPDQQKQMAGEIAGKAPTGTGQDPKTTIELARLLGEQSYQKAQLGMEDKRLKLEQEQHQDTLNLRRDQLQASIQEHAEALKQKDIAEQDKVENWQAMRDLRGQQMEISRQLAQERIDEAGDSPKSRQKWIDNQMTEFQKERSDAAKAIQKFSDKGLFGRILTPDNKQSLQTDLDSANSKIKALQGIADDYKNNKISSADAITKIYDAGGGTDTSNVIRYDSQGNRVQSSAPKEGP